MKYDAIIVASGKGQRANLGYNKVFYEMADGKSVLDHSIALFDGDADCEQVIVVTNADCFDRVKGGKVIVTEGGEQRKDSVFNGLKLVKSAYVLIHDGARPFLHRESLEALKEKVFACGAAILGRMAFDTVKEVEDGRIVRTLDRQRIFLAETPQGFRTDLIKDCFARCEDIAFTDDASLLESLGHEVHIVIDRYDNRKLTKEEDFRDL